MTQGGRLFLRDLGRLLAWDHRSRCASNMTTTGTATPLFTDLVGLTELQDWLGDGPFEWRPRTQFRLLPQAVTQSGRQKVKNRGNGIPVGCWPPRVRAARAHADRPERYCVLSSGLSRSQFTPHHTPNYTGAVCAAAAKAS